MRKVICIVLLLMCIPLLFAQEQVSTNDVVHSPSCQHKSCTK